MSQLQGAKREREVSPYVPVSPDTQAEAAAAPPAKRVRAPTPVAEPIPPSNQGQQALASVAEPTPAASQAQQQAVLPSTSQTPAEETQAPIIMPETDDAPAPQASEAAGEAGATSAATEQQHIARVAVTQQDPERVQVKIEMPSSVVHVTNPDLPQDISTYIQLGGAQPAQQMEDVQQMKIAQPAATNTEVAEAVDVDMTEGPATASSNAAQSEEPGDDTEDGELPDADEFEADEQEAPEAQLQATPAAGDSAAATSAGQGDASDADGNAGGTGRKPIIFNLQGAGVSEPSPSVTGSQPRTSRPPPSGIVRSSWGCWCTCHLMEVLRQPIMVLCI